LSKNEIAIFSPVFSSHLILMEMTLVPKPLSQNRTDQFPGMLARQQTPKTNKKKFVLALITLFGLFALRISSQNINRVACHPSPRSGVSPSQTTMVTVRPAENSNCYCYGIYCCPSLHHLLFSILICCFQVGFLRLAEMTHNGEV